MVVLMQAHAVQVLQQVEQQLVEGAAELSLRSSICMVSAIISVV